MNKEDNINRLDAIIEGASKLSSGETGVDSGCHRGDGFHKKTLHSSGGQEGDGEEG